MKILTREEAMERLRMKPSQFSKVSNGKVKGLPRIPVYNIGRRQFIREEMLDQWIIALEEKACSEAP